MTWPRFLLVLAACVAGGFGLGTLIAAKWLDDWLSHP